jgi:hypothetical protein
MLLVIVFLLVIIAILWNQRTGLRIKSAADGISLQRIVALLQAAAERNVFLYFGMLPPKAQHLEILSGHVSGVRIDDYTGLKADVFCDKWTQRIELSHVLWITIDAPGSEAVIVSELNRRHGYLLAIDWRWVPSSERVEGSPFMPYFVFYNELFERILMHPKLPDGDS